MDSKQLLAKALALRDSGNTAEAASALESLIAQHPDSDSADVAKSHLFNLQSGGGADTTDSSQDQEVLPANIARVVLTTAPTISGSDVTTTLGIVAAECAFGMNMFADFAASIRDVFGGRSGAWQNALRRARHTCLNELKREASTLGADAVIAVSLNYSEISGGGKQMLFLVASGTAVRLSRSKERVV